MAKITGYSHKNYDEKLCYDCLVKTYIPLFGKYYKTFLNDDIKNYYLPIYNDQAEKITCQHCNKQLTKGK